MPIIQNGKPAVALRYVDEQGAEHQVVQAWLGDRLVWDGTMPALKSMPRAIGAGFVRPALVSAGQVQGMPLADHSAGEARPAVISAGANMAMPCATGMGGFALPPSLFAGVEAAMSTADGDGVAYPAVAGEATPGAFYMPRATGGGEVYPAVVSVPFEREVPRAIGVGEVAAPTVYGEASRALDVATGSGAVNPATTRHGQSQPMPRAVGSGSANPAVASAAVNMAMPRAVGTGQVNPAVVRVSIPMGLDKVGAQSTTANAWAVITGWQIRSGFPDTNHEGDGIRLLPGVYKLESKHTRSVARQMGVRLYLGSTMVGEVIASSSTTTVTCTVATIEVTEPDTLLTTRGMTPSGNSVLDGATNTYLTATLA